MTQIEIGRLLRAGTTGFTAGCRVSQMSVPSFGALVHVPLGDGYQVYGLIHDIHIDDDGLVRQLVTAENVTAEVMQDNRERRIVPVEMSVLCVGYEQDGLISQLDTEVLDLGSRLIKARIGLVGGHRRENTHYVHRPSLVGRDCAGRIKSCI